jgi:hypothetical protein
MSDEKTAKVEAAVEEEDGDVVDDDAVTEEQTVERPYFHVIHNQQDKATASDDKARMTSRIASRPHGGEVLHFHDFNPVNCTFSEKVSSEALTESSHNFTLANLSSSSGTMIFHRAAQDRF